MVADGETSSLSDGITHIDPKLRKKIQKRIKFDDLFKGSASEEDISMEKQQKKRSRQKKLKAYDLSSLSEHLPELSSPSASVLESNSKTMNELVLKEANQLRRVISHPNFQSDPLGVIFQHLQNTQPDYEEKPESKDRKTEKKKKKSSGLLSMEI